jgi:hypothetical protein
VKRGPGCNVCVFRSLQVELALSLLHRGLDVISQLLSGLQLFHTLHPSLASSFLSPPPQAPPPPAPAAAAASTTSPPAPGGDTVTETTEAGEGAGAEEEETGAGVGLSLWLQWTLLKLGLSMYSKDAAGNGKSSELQYQG